MTHKDGLKSLLNNSEKKTWTTAVLRGALKLLQLHMATGLSLPTPGLEAAVKSTVTYYVDAGFNSCKKLLKRGPWLIEIGVEWFFFQLKRGQDKILFHHQHFTVVTLYYN